jgi:hypothetical protein
MVKNLVLSLATNARFQDFSRFVRSARRHLPAEETDIVIFMNPLGPEFSALADELSVDIAPVSSLWREVTQSVPLKVAFRAFLRFLDLGSALNLRHFPELTRAIVSGWVHVQAGRYLVYHEYLKVRPNYRCVLLTDSRDVVFQADPFPHVDPEVLNVFEQDPSIVFGEANVDSDWFAKIYGPSMLERLRGKQTICSGTTMASPRVLSHYLDLMEKEIIKYRATPLDQAMHNKLVHLVIEERGIKRHPNVSGCVLTLAGMGTSEYEVVGDDVRVRGRLVPILHQYDRVPALDALLTRVYGGSLAVGS